MTDLLAYCAGLLEQRRADPRDDLVSHMATTGDDAGYGPEECAGFLAGLVFAGNDTTRNQIGWMVADLADRPDLWDAIGTGRRWRWTPRWRSSCGTAVLRPRSRGGRRSRWSWTGATLASGTPVLLSLWGADSDPAAYPAAADLDPVANAGIAHLGFGHGPHHCLGAALARVRAAGVAAGAVRAARTAAGPGADRVEPADRHQRAHPAAAAGAAAGHMSPSAPRRAHPGPGRCRGRPVRAGRRSGGGGGGAHQAAVGQCRAAVTWMAWYSGEVTICTNAAVLG